MLSIILIGLGILIVFALAGQTASKGEAEATPTGEKVGALVTAEQQEKDAAEIERLENEVAGIPESDIVNNLRIYKELARLSPLNSDYNWKVTKYEAELITIERYRNSPEEAVDIVTVAWSKGGFGSVMQIDRLELRNKAPFAIKDFVVECIHYGPSGTKIDSNTRTIYEMIEASETKNFRDLNMGFIHSQAVSSACQVTEAVSVVT